MKFPAVLVNYRFTGFLDEIYATLVVRLHHTEAFQKDERHARYSISKSKMPSTFTGALSQRDSRASALLSL